MGDVEEGSSSGPVPELVVATDVSTRTASNGTSTHRMSFVDYVPPPPRPIPPPAKFKLWFMVIFCVFFADWLSYEAGFLSWLEDTFKLSRNGALFILLGCIVCALVYGTLDLLIFCFRIKIHGKWYGLGSWLKQPRIQWVHEYNNFLVEFVACIVVIFEEGFALFNAPKADKAVQPKQFDCDEDHDVVLKIENRIRPDKAEEYVSWREKLISQGCHTRPGLKSIEHKVIEDPKGDLHVTYLTFTSIDLLNEYMTSPIRARLIRKLQPLLLVPSITQLQKDRALPDALTDLCTRQGQAVPVRLPKKWKVWFITTLGLWFVVLITNATLNKHYFNEWGLYNAHIRVQSLVRVLFNTFLNTYVMTPFLLMIFGDWMRREGKEGDDHEPWRTLNDGASSVLGKVVVFLVFYGGCAIAWGVNGGA